MELHFVQNNAIFANFLTSINGILAVLNEHRQVLAVNHAFLEMIGLEDAGDILGLRPGEAVNCAYADKEPNGCGTTKYCTTCGAAIAIVTSLAQNMPVERICSLRTARDGSFLDHSLLVRAHPIRVQGTLFVLLFLQDITLEEKRAALERTFFHDINNILCILLGASENLLEDQPSKLANLIHQTCMRLKNEISIQRCLIESDTYTYKPSWHMIDSDRIFEDLTTFFAKHPLARSIHVHFDKPVPSFRLKTDISLLMRILYNMITNALEASEEDGEIHVWTRNTQSWFQFFVKNDQVIPREITYRIFQRNFSTKKGSGRGVGTFSMKFLGEEILGGQVQFTSSPEQGTIFSISLPVFS